MRKDPSAPQAWRRGDRLFVRVCLFLTGACTLVLEIVGTRLISPYYGSSLYSWSALITVTLVSLAAGYHWGGKLADRTPTLTLAARLLSAAAVTVAATPSLRAAVLHATTPLGLQLGALTAAAALVAPALVLLSALGPLAVRLTAQELAVVGRSAGDVYAVSTVGSVLGAMLAGFVLIPRLPLTQILYGASALLLLLATWAQFLSQRRLPLAQPALAAAIVLYGFWPRAAARTAVIHSKETPYGQIRVIDGGGRRYLTINGALMSVADTATMDTLFPYTLAMEWAAAAKPGSRRALMIGLGAGLMTSALEREYGLVVDSVDVDPEMERVARRYFRFAPKGDVLLEDGRRVLESSATRYDLIFLDAFGAETQPFHLFTAEAFAAMRRRLAPDGILSINLASIVHGDGGKAWRSVYRTLASVFPHVRAYQANETAEDVSSIVFFCGAQELPEPRMPARARTPLRPVFEFMLEHPLRPDDRPAELMTDDFAPMDVLQAETSAKWRRGLLATMEKVLRY